jgi:hypothetical protein
MAGKNGTSVLIVSLEQSQTHFARPSLIVWLLKHVINEQTLPGHRIVDHLTLQSLN